MRPVRVVIMALFVLLLAYKGGRILESMKKTPPRISVGADVRSVPVMEARNGVVQAYVESSGKLEARERAEIFAEVSGVLLSGSVPFKVGSKYSNGQAMLRLDNTEAKLSLLAQKSAFMNSLAQLMPDLKLDYPASFPAWDKYLEQLELDERLAPLPKPANAQEKYFLSGRNIYNQYYSLKSQEERLDKYSLTAPFSGTLVEANINPGTLVRVGQKLGELVSDGSYELEAPISLSELGGLEVGDSAVLRSEDLAGEWPATVTRINKQVDQGTQSTKVILTVKGDDLVEGMYLSGVIKTQKVDNALSVPRGLLYDNQYVFLVAKDSTLLKRPVTIRSFSGDNAIIQGVKDKELLVGQTLVGAYHGMKVYPYEASNTQRP